MNRRSLSVLIVLNVVLLAAIALTLGPVQKAEAQLGGGSYLMIAGNSSAAPQQQIVYVMDTRTGRVAAFAVNSATKKVDVIGTREIADDLRKGVGGGGR